MLTSCPIPPLITGRLKKVAGNFLVRPCWPMKLFPNALEIITCHTDGRTSGEDARMHKTTPRRMEWRHRHRCVDDRQLTRMQKRRGFAPLS